MDKFCVNCKFAVKSHYNENYYSCKKTEYISLVTGLPILESCIEARGKFSPCGIEGKLFEGLDVPF